MAAKTIKNGFVFRAVLAALLLATAFGCSDDTMEEKDNIPMDKTELGRDEPGETGILDKETAARIAQLLFDDFIGQSPPPLPTNPNWSENDTKAWLFNILTYLGNYNGYFVFYSGPGQLFWPWVFTVDGIRIASMHSGPTFPRHIVFGWKNDQYTNIRDLYEQGFFSREDLLEMAEAPRIPMTGWL